MGRRGLLPWATQPPSPQLNLDHPLVKTLPIDVWTPDRPNGHINSVQLTKISTGSTITSGTPGLGFTTSGQTLGSAAPKGLNTNQQFLNASAWTIFALFESFDAASATSAGGPFGESLNGFTFHGATTYPQYSAILTYRDVSLANATATASFAPPVAKVPVLWVATADIFGAGLKAFTNGKLITTTAVAPYNFIISGGSFSINTGIAFTFLDNWNGRVYLAGAIQRAWKDTEVVAFSQNPWQIFQPRQRIFAALAGTVSTTSRPGADVSVVGWSFTGSSLSASINEVTRNDASYIEAAYGVTGSIVTLDIPRSPGNHTISFTSEYLVGFASSGQFKFSLLDDTNTVLGTTGWQAVTSIIVQYDLPVTISSTATRLKIEIQA